MVPITLIFGNPLDLNSEALPEDSRVRDIFQQSRSDSQEQQFRQLFQEIRDSIVLEEAYYFYFLSLKHAGQNQSILHLLQSWEPQVPSKRTALAGTYYLLSDPKTIELGFLYRFINQCRSLHCRELAPAYWDFLKGILLARRGMKGAAYEIMRKQNDFFVQNPNYDYFYWLGKTSYDTDHWEDALNYLSLAYLIKPDMEVYSLIDLTAQKKGLSSQEEKMLFQRLMKPNLEKAPDFALPDLGNSVWKLSQFKGQFVLLVFWASWCGPCQQELPLIEQFQQHKPEYLTILGINTEGRADRAGKVKERLSLSFPILLADPTVQANYGVQSIPRSILIDPEGTIILRIVGASPQIQEIVLDRIKFMSDL